MVYKILVDDHSRDGDQLLKILMLVQTFLLCTKRNTGVERKLQRQVCSDLGSAGTGDLLGRGAPRGEKNSEVQHYPILGSVRMGETSWEGGC